MFRRERGTTTVEFAIIGTVLMTILFAMIEFGRALFVMNALTEVTRRAARVATVCPVNDPAGASAGVFGDGDGRSTVVNGLTTGNLTIEYLDQAGNVVADPVGGFGNIRYVRARIVNFTHQLVIPFVMPSITMPAFPAVVPRESLGIPREGVVEPC
jgi:Flp pilus assembly protein TadG